MAILVLTMSTTCMSLELILIKLIDYIRMVLMNTL